MGWHPLADDQSMRKFTASTGESQRNPIDKKARGGGGDGLRRPKGMIPFGIQRHSVKPLMLF